MALLVDLVEADDLDGQQLFQIAMLASEQAKQEMPAPGRVTWEVEV